MWIRSSRCESTHCVEWRTSTRSCDSANCVEFRTSTRSFNAGECVEYATSTYCLDNGNCVQVAGCDCVGLPHVALVRDSKDPAGPVLAFDAGSWQTAMDGIKGGAWRLHAVR